MLETYKVLLWDFDGVIMDSMPIRSNGFRIVLKQYPKKQVDELMDFHNTNGGLSRYVKFRYFFETIRGEEITEDEVQQISNSFSKIMLESLLDERLLIDDSMQFIRENSGKYEMHIVSGSDGEELRKICSALGLSKFFRSINGSPTPKKQLVKNLLKTTKRPKDEICLIGDSINDYEAAKFNEVDFFGYNNPSLRQLQYYINTFQPGTDVK